MAHKHSGAEYIIKPWGKYYICEECRQEFESWKRKIINAVFWKWRFYCGRGEMFISDINGLISVMGGLGVIFLLISGWFGTLPNGIILISIWVFQKLLVFYLGYKDFHKWHIFQNEATISIQFSPPTIEMLERMRNTEKILAEKTGQEYKKESVLDEFQK